MNSILIVDDFHSVRHFHEALLRKAGFSCLTAASGEEAWRMLQQEAIGAVVLDLLMPGWSGEEVLSRMRADARLREVPVIVITSEPAERLAAIPFTSVLVKPVLPNQLVGAVRTATGTEKAVR